VHILRSAFRTCPASPSPGRANNTNACQAHEHHRAHLESLPESELSYPLGPKGNAAEVSESQRVTDEPLGQR
jgi:hypothetical protein